MGVPSTFVRRGSPPSPSGELGCTPFRRPCRPLDVTDTSRPFNLVALARRKRERTGSAMTVSGTTGEGQSVWNLVV